MAGRGLRIARAMLEGMIITGLTPRPGSPPADTEHDAAHSRANGETNPVDQ